MFNSYSLDQQKDNMAHLVEVYAKTLTRLTHDAELLYPYAKQDGQSDKQHAQELKQNMAGLILIIGAALSELATVTHVTPVALETLSELMPHEQTQSNKSSLSQSELLQKVADKVGKFQALLSAVDPNPANMVKSTAHIKQEIDACNGLMKELKALPGWENVIGIGNVKLLSDVLQRGVELSGKPRSRL